MSVPIAIPVAVDDIFEVRWTGFLHGQQVMNTFHYKVTSASAPTLTGTNFGELGEAFELAVSTPFLNLLSQELTGLAIQIQKIEPARYLAYTYYPDPAVGQVAGSALPSGVAVVIRRRAQEAGRYAQGRIYVPGLPVSAENDSQLTDLAFANWSGIMQGMLTDLAIPDTVSLSPVLYNKQIGTALYDVQVVELDRNLRYQRRREVGRGS